MTQAPEAAASPASCAAQLLPEGFECRRCGLAWDDGDAPPACAPMTFALAFVRMAAHVNGAAEDLEASQRALVAAGLRPRRDQGKLERAMVLRMAARLIERCAADAAICDRLKAKRQDTQESKQ